MAENWSREFDEPIALPDGRELRTLLEAKQYIHALRASRRIKPEWQTAYRSLTLAAQDARSLMLPGWLFTTRWTSDKW